MASQLLRTFKKQHTTPCQHANLISLKKEIFEHWKENYKTLSHDICIRLKGVFTSDLYLKQVYHESEEPLPKYSAVHPHPP